MAINNDELAFIESVKNKHNKAKENNDISSIQSLLNTLARGTVKGIQSFGRAFGPTMPYTQQESLDIERFPEQVEEFFPTRGTSVEKGIERALGIFPFAAAGGMGAGESVLRSLGAGALGQGAEELGFSPLGQAIAELPAFLTPNLSKNIPVKKGEEALRSFATEAGITERELPLVLEEAGKLKRTASKIARPGKKSEVLIKDTKEILGSAWRTLENSEIAKTSLTPRNQSKFTESIAKQLEKLPSESRKKISEDYKDLLKSGFKGSDLINFWQDLNYYIAKGERSLGTLKNPLQKAIESISPELKKDFMISNELWRNFSENSKLLKAKPFEQLINFGEVGALISGIVTGNYGLLETSIGTFAAREVARELISNPRLQRMSKRLATSLNNGKISISKQILDKMIPEIAKKEPLAAKKLSETDLEEIFKLEL